MRYIVTAETPKYADGCESPVLRRGDVVDVETLTTDDDGDFFVRVVESHDAERVGAATYVLATDVAPGETLEEVVTISVASVRAALVAVGHEALAEKVLRIAQAVEAAR